MPISRYRIDSRINLGEQLGTASAITIIRAAIKSKNLIPVNQIIMTGDDRLDALAGAVYGDAKYWWILAACSKIGWGMQCPPGTVLNIFKLGDVLRLIG
jgi:hypothetical protein